MKTIGVFIPHSRVSAWRFAFRHKELLARLLPDTQITVCESKDDFEKILPSIRIALVWYFKQEWYAKAGQLEWLVTPAAGRDFLRTKPPKRVAVHNCHFHGQIMAETVAGMILAHCRGIVKAYELQTKAEWPQAELESGLTTLRGKTVTVLGFGSIGQWIARLLKPFGVRIIGVKRNAITLPQFLDSGDKIITLRDMDSELAQTDHLVLALPGDTGTDKIVAARRLGLLPRHAAVYNVGRGNAIDEDALYSALKKGGLAAAFLDVFRQEPLAPESPLRTCPNCYLMPHVSALAPNYLDLFVEEVAREYRKKYC
ncbi:MAG: hydroxyacid dehydrogenase [Spirochaetales bacterium]|nr:hydroxyacid dehydrogenase [Spirochaetales bacterium]